MESGEWMKHQYLERSMVPGNVSRKIDSVRGQNLLRTVDELINPTTGLWDEELIQDTFHPIEAQNILEIPKSPNLEEDFVAWHKKKIQFVLLIILNGSINFGLK
jgi:hypothetical protein